MADKFLFFFFFIHIFYYATSFLSGRATFDTHIYFLSIQCNVTQISEKMNRYGNLIKTGLVAFNYFAVTGQMPIV
jgi:hypothetical protein